MENNNFEIKIFANVSGFSEGSYLGPQYTSDFFGLELIKKRNFDGDGDSFSDGTFSVFFTPDIYVITLHFDVTSEAKFRSNRVHMAVAIKRLCKLNNPREVFNTLKVEFLKLSSKYKDSITSQSTFIWEPFVKTLQVNVVPDTSQPKFAVSDTNIRSLVVYDTDDQLDLLLKELHREEFENIGTLYILKKIDNNTNSSILGRKYNTIPITNYEYKRTFILKFPDGHNKIIESLDSEVNYTCKKKFYKDKVFKGKLSDHIADWSVQKGTDNRTYSITCQLEPEIKEYIITCIDEKTSKEHPEYLQKLIFNPGQLKGNKWIITGSDNEKNKSYRSSSNDLVIKDTKETSDTITIVCRRLFCYDLKELFKNLNLHGESEAKAYLYENSDRHVAIFDKNNTTQYLPYAYRDVHVKLKEMVAYEDHEIFFDPNGRLGYTELQKRESLSVEFRIKNNEISCNLNKNPITCTYKVRNENKKEILTELCRVDNLLPGTYEFTLSVKGFKDITKTITLQKKSKTLNVEFEEDKTYKRIKKFKVCIKYGLLPCLAIFIYLMGFFTCYQWWLKPNYDKNIELFYSYSKQLTEARDSIHKLTNELKGSIDSRKAPATQLNNDASKDNTSSTLPLVDPNLEKLVNKIKYSFDFTKDDIKKLTQLDKSKQYTKLITSANACFYIINVDKEEVDYVKSKRFKQLQGDHIKLKNEIFDNKKNDFSNAYLSITKKDFTTVNEFLDKLHRLVTD